MIFIFGDSHADFNFRNLDIPHHNLREYSRTMHRIGRDNIIINFNEKFNNKENIFIILYGEVDIRCHVKRQIDLGFDEFEVIDKLVENYFNTIKNNIKEYKKIIICSVTPPVNAKDHEKMFGIITHEFPILGTDEQRVLWTKYINTKLEEYCNKNNFSFLDVYEHYSTKEGLLNWELSDYNAHIQKNDFILTELKKLLIKTSKMTSKITSEGMTSEISNKITSEISNKITSEISNKITTEHHNLFSIKNVINYHIGQPNYNEWIIEHLELEDSFQKSQEINHYFMIDTDQNEAFSHWVFESAINLIAFKELKIKIPNLKLVLKAKRKYKKLFLEKLEINEMDVIYENKIELPNVSYFCEPIFCWCEKEITDKYKKHVDLFYDLFSKKNNKTIDILLMPRQKLENCKPNDRIYDTEILENEIKEINENGLLHTDKIDNIEDQLNKVNSSKTIILTDGSPFLVNGMFAKSSLILIIGNCTPSQSIIYKKLGYIVEKNKQNNNVIYLPEMKYSIENINYFLNGSRS